MPSEALKSTPVLEFIKRVAGRLEFARGEPGWGWATGIGVPAGRLMPSEALKSTPVLEFIKRVAGRLEFDRGEPGFAQATPKTGGPQTLPPNCETASVSGSLAAP
jgi:hypothetical protein